MSTTQKYMAGERKTLTNVLRQKVETAISRTRPRPARKKEEVRILVVERARKKTHRCALVAKQ